MSWDVAVVGGGLGGAAAASRLALAGRQVVLFEREHGRHDKVCGEFLSGDAAAELTELDVRLDCLGAMPIERVRVVSGRIEAAASLPFPAWGLSRRRLDDRLLRHAARHGAEVRRGTTVRALEVDGGGVRLQCSDGFTTAAAAILASGKHDLRGWRRPGASKLIGLKLHLRLDETQRRALAGHVELALFDAGYVGLLLVEDGLANLCLVVSRDRFTALGRDWRRLVATVPHLAGRLDGACALHARPLAIAGMPYGYLTDVTTTAPVYRVGDQAAVIPSFAGDGMAMALHSGRRAGEAILRGHTAALYHRELAATFRAPVRLAGTVAAVAAAPTARWWLAVACRATPWLVGRIATATRIGRSGAI
jgi:flavin-dependent dehydrogenase